MGTGVATRRRVVAAMGMGIATIVGLDRYGVAQEASPPGSPASSPPATPAGSPAASPATSPVASAAPAPRPAAASLDPGGGATTVAVRMREFAFVPREIAIPADTDVAIVLTNGGATMHNFRLTGIDEGSELLAPGATSTITLNLAAGEYRVVCTIPGHADLGMVAKLVVG